MNKDYSQFNSFVLKRVYSERKIRVRLGGIPSDVRPVDLPSFLERIVGKLYIVNESQRALIRGEEYRALLIVAKLEAQQIQRSFDYIKVNI